MTIILGGRRYCPEALYNRQLQEGSKQPSYQGNVRMECHLRAEMGRACRSSSSVGGGYFSGRMRWRKETGRIVSHCSHLSDTTCQTAHTHTHTSENFLIVRPALGMAQFAHKTLLSTATLCNSCLNQKCVSLHIDQEEVCLYPQCLPEHWLLCFTTDGLVDTVDMKIDPP